MIELQTDQDLTIPQSPDSERCVLGAVLLNSECFYRVIGICSEPHFFRNAHRKILAAMRALAESNRPIDLMTVKNELVDRGELVAIGGAAYLSGLTDVVPDIANVESYARRVKKKAELRGIITACNAGMHAAAENGAEPDEVLGGLEQSLAAIAEDSAEDHFESAGQLSRASIATMERLQSSGRRLVTGVPTGFERFNEFTSGFQPGELIIIAARPSAGKTSFAMNIAEAIGVPGRDGLPYTDRLYTTAVFSMEMSKQQVSDRMLSSVSGVSAHLMRANMLSERNWRDLADANVRLSKAKVFIDDSSALDVMGMKAKVRRLRAQHGLDLIFVDFLQLMSSKLAGRNGNESRSQEVGAVSRGLKRLAMDQGVPVVALAQLSRRPEQRSGDHRPQLSDLRESGEIEQNADVVCFIHRDEMYNRDSEQKGIAEIIIGKNRNGPIGDFNLVFRNDITRFYDYTPQPDYLPADDQRGLY